MELIIVSSPRANVWNKLVSMYVKGLEQCLRRSRGYASFSSRYFSSLTSFPITTTLFLGPSYNELPVDPLGQSLLTVTTYAVSFAWNALSSIPARNYHSPFKSQEACPNSQPRTRFSCPLFLCHQKPWLLPDITMICLSSLCSC